MFAEPLEVLARVTAVLESAGVPYLVGGSFASSTYGIPRATQDVDLVAAVRPEHVEGLVRALEAEFYIDAGMIQDAIRRRASFNVIHLATAYKADIFILPASLWAREEMTRRRVEILDSEAASLRLYLSSPEDTILHKLDWYRQGGGVSDR